MADGRLEEAVEAVNTFKARADEMGDRLLSLADGCIALTPFFHPGRLAEARVLTEGLTEFYDTGNRFVSAFMALTEALSDNPSEAAGRLTTFMAKGRLADRSAADLAMFLQVALILGDTNAVRLIAQELKPVAGDVGVLGDATCVARHLGDASAFLGDVETARGTTSRRWTSRRGSGSGPRSPWPALRSPSSCSATTRRSENRRSTTSTSRSANWPR